jgi:hypothetical protein
MEAGDGEQVHGAAEGEVLFEFCGESSAVAEEECFGGGAVIGAEALLELEYGLLSEGVEESAEGPWGSGLEGLDGGGVSEEDLG